LARRGRGEPYSAAGDEARDGIELGLHVRQGELMRSRASDNHDIDASGDEPRAHPERLAEEALYAVPFNGAADLS
jgi:hypothetical protein